MSVRKNPYTADPKTRQAKAKGYPARSVFKLEEIDRRFRLIPAKGRVLDLGAAPGSWTLYASQRVGSSGKVVAIDLKPLTLSPLDNVVALEGDALSQASDVLAAFAPYDVILSDMAPNTSGNKSGDQARSLELFLSALEIAERFGKPGSGFAGKLFMGPEFSEAKKKLAELYREARVARPEATRQRSSEVFLVGKGLRKRPDR